MSFLTIRCAVPDLDVLHGPRETETSLVLSRLSPEPSAQGRVLPRQIDL
jgi:hypothetical protein